jgi:hypothetical protein
MSNPLTKDNNKDYEHIPATMDRMREKGIMTGYTREGGWTFGSGSPVLFKRISRLFIAEDAHGVNKNSTIIPGLRCPDCYACAHKTDVPNVATCCSPIGWFFFYRRLDQDVSSKARLVVKNGEMVLVEGQDKSESSF